MFKLIAWWPWVLVLAPFQLMFSYESNWLNDCPGENKPIFYRRDVDNTFFLFKQYQHIPKFLSYFNSKHPNIEFTYDTKQWLYGAFRCTRNNNCTQQFTFTGLGINYLFIAQLFDINAIGTHPYRCYSLSSNWFTFYHEVNFLRTFFFP